jgi:aminoglycoside phosphotransferase (APT) family kinase protein
MPALRVRHTEVMERTAIDATLVRRLIGSQFPEWSDLEVAPVDLDGWDNATFRLGDDLSVRLPSPLRTYADETEAAVSPLAGAVDVDRARATWREAMTARWDGSAV